MATTTTERPALTTTAGNPAHSIRSQYTELMKIECVDTLKATATGLLDKGISPKNKLKFTTVLKSETDLTKLRFYLTNFILAADKLNVIQTGSRNSHTSPR